MENKNIKTLKFLKQRCEGDERNRQDKMRKPTMKLISSPSSIGLENAIRRPETLAINSKQFASLLKCKSNADTAISVLDNYLSHMQILKIKLKTFYDALIRVSRTAAISNRKGTHDESIRNDEMLELPSRSGSPALSSGYKELSRIHKSPTLKGQSLDSKDDGTWTLKYFKDDEGKNQELIAGSNIYISKYELKNILAIAKKQTDLARALLITLFTEEALEQCSFTGTKPRGNGKGGLVRPGLHKGARVALLAFVRQYAEQQKWEKRDDQTITTSIRNKLTELRQTIKLNQELFED